MNQRDQSYPTDLPSDELICFPFLDTGSDEQRRAVCEELLRRGYPFWLVQALRKVASVGLWYQVIDWEWGSLGIFDVMLGYGAILLLSAPFVHLFSPATSGILLSAGILSLGAALVGFLWRRARFR